MAGDIGRRERVIVLPESTQMGAAAQDARASLDRTGSGTVHEYGDRVLVVDLPEIADAEVVDELTAWHADIGPSDDAAAFGSATVDALDEAGALGLAAFGLRSSGDFAVAKADRPHADEDWDQPGGDVLPPDPPPEIAEGIEGPSAHGRFGASEGSTNGDAPAGAAASSGRLMGSVAVGIVIVEGPTPALKFSHAERVKVVAEVQNGLAWLGAQSGPNGITWSYDVRIITISAQPSAADDTLAKKEARFRDPALAAMGFGAGVNGAQAYVNQLRATRRTNWAYCAFFTKYPVGHFAYASLGGPRLVMHYDNDGWGPDSIDRVFAHETGHIFNAPDEYAGSGCNCGGQWGHFKVANGNCNPCASNPVACIMKANTWAMCPFTPRHLGFPQGARYTGVYVSGSDAHALWTNASWQPFVAKWQQLSGQGLRLVDLDVASIGSQLRYSGAFRAGGGSYGLWAMADYPSFQQKWQQWSGQGMRLIDLEVTQVGSNTRYSGVFRAGGGSYGLWVNATYLSFLQKWNQWSAQGLRLVDLSVRMVGTTPRYSGVFVQGSGAYAMWALASWSSFQQKWQELSQQGLRLIDVERTMVGGQARYSGIFREGTGSYGLSANSTWQVFLERHQQWTANGLRLVDVSMEPTGVEAAASPEPASAGAVGEPGLIGMLGFGGAPIAMEPDDVGAVAGEGMLDLTPADAEDVDDAAGIGVGTASFDDDAGRANTGPSIPRPLPVTASRMVEQPTASNDTGMGGVSFVGASSATTPAPTDPGDITGDGDGGIVVVDVTEDAAPERSGVGARHDDD